MADESKTITIMFRGDATQLNDTTSNIDKMIKVLQNDTKALEKQMKFGGDYDSQMKLYGEALNNVSEALNLAKINQERWNDEIDKYQSKRQVTALTEKELDSLLTAQRKYAEYTKKIENLTEEYKRLATEKINYSKISVAKALDEERRKADNLGKSIDKIANAFKYVSLAAGAALTSAGAAAISFEEAMANVRKVLKPEEETYFETIRQEILELSKSLPIAANDIAQVAANALQLGVAATDVGKFTETVIKLGTATNITADEGSIALAQFFNVVGENLDNIDKFGATLTRLGNNFQTSEDHILSMSNRLAAAGRSVGFTTDEVLALATALASTGLSAEAAGSSISTIIRNIDKEIATEGDYIEAWGKFAMGKTGYKDWVKDFQKMWSDDSFGTLNVMLKNIKAAADNGENLNVIMSRLGINAIRQTDAFSRLVLGLDNYNKAIVMSKDAWEEIERGEEGALNTEVAQRIDTIASKWKILLNTITAIGIQLGDTLKPTIKAVIDYAQRLADSFARLSPETQAWIVKLLAGLAVIYPALKGLSTLILGWRDLLKGISGLVKSTIKPFSSWVQNSAFLRFGDFLKVAVDNTKKLTAAFGDFLVKIFSGKAPLESLEAIGNFGVGDAVGKVLGVMSALKTIAIGLAAAFAVLYATNEQFKESINNILLSLLDSLKLKLADVWETLKMVGGWISQEFSDLIKTLIDLWQKYLEPALSYLLIALAKLASDTLVDLTGILGGLVKILAVSLANILEFIIDAIRALATLLAPLISLVAKLFGKIVEFVTWAAEKLRPGVEWLLGGMEKIGELVVGFLIVAFDALARVIEWVGTKIGELYDWFGRTDVLRVFIDTIKAIKDAINNIVKPIEDAIRKMKELMSLGSSSLFGDIMGNSGYKVSGTRVYVNNNQTNTFNTNSVNGAAQQAANNILEMVNNGIGKQLDTRGW